MFVAELRYLGSVQQSLTVASGDHPQGAVAGRRLVEVETQGNQARKHGRRSDNVRYAVLHGPGAEALHFGMHADCDDPVLMEWQFPVRLGSLVEQGGLDGRGIGPQKLRRKINERRVEGEMANDREAFHE